MRAQKSINSPYFRIVALVEKMGKVIQDGKLWLEIKEALAITYYEIGLKKKSHTTLIACIQADLTNHSGDNLCSMLYAGRYCGLSQQQLKGLLAKVLDNENPIIVQKAKRCMQRLGEYESCREDAQAAAISRNPRVPAVDVMSMDYVKELIYQGQFSRLDVIMYSITRGKNGMCPHAYAKLILEIYRELIKVRQLQVAERYQKRIIDLMRCEEDAHCVTDPDDKLACRYYTDGMVELMEVLYRGRQYDTMLDFCATWAKIGGVVLAEQVSYYVGRLLTIDYALAQKFLGTVKSDKSAYSSCLDQFVRFHYEKGEIGRVIEYCELICGNERKMWSLATEMLNFEEHYHQKMITHLPKLTDYVDSLVLRQPA